MRQFLLLLILNLLHSFLQAQQDDPLIPVRLLLINEKYEELVSVTDTLMVPDSIKAEMNYYTGQAFRELSMHDSALYCFQQAHAGDSLNLSYGKAVGRAYHSLGRTREAIQVFEDGLAKDPLDRKLRIDLAALYLSRRQYAESLGLYRNLIEGDSLNYLFYKQAGRCFLTTGPEDSTLYYFEKAFKLNPADPYLTQQITNMYLRKKDLDMAFETMRKGFQYDMDNPDLLRLRGYLWFVDNNYKLAIDDFTESALQDSNSAFTYKYLGLSYFEVRLYDDSREALSRAFQLDSLDAETVFFLGSACRWSKHEEEAVEYYLKTIELLKPLPGQLKNTHIQLAELYKVLHRFDLALEAYREAYSYDTLDNVIFFRMAQVYDQNLDQKRLAIEYYEKYLSGMVTDHQLFDATEGTSEILLQHVQERIDYLKGELFFEE